MKTLEEVKEYALKRIEGINYLCDQKKTRRGRHSIARSNAINQWENLIWLIDNPDYQPKEQEESPFTSSK